VSNDQLIYKLKTTHLKKVCKAIIFITFSYALICVGVFLISGYTSIFLLILTAIAWGIASAFMDLENKNLDENRSRYMMYILANLTVNLLFTLYILLADIQGIFPNVASKWIF